MAFIGMRHVVAAEFNSHTPGSEPTYKSTGWDVGKAISGNLTITRNTNPLRADDEIAEDDNGITDMELELGVDDITEDIQAKMGMLKEVTAGSPQVTTYYDTTGSSKDIGLGYMRVRRKHGVTKYQAIWIYKAKFAKNSENAQTKGESIEWQTPTVNGKCAPLDVDGSGEDTFRKIRNFDTEAAANTYLDGLAGITRT